MNVYMHVVWGTSDQKPFDAGGSQTHAFQTVFLEVNGMISAVGWGRQRGDTHCAACTVFTLVSTASSCIQGVPRASVAAALRHRAQSDEQIHHYLSNFQK